MSIKIFYDNYMSIPVYNPYSQTEKVIFLSQNVSARLRFCAKSRGKNASDMVFYPKKVF